MGKVPLGGFRRSTLEEIVNSQLSPNLHSAKQTFGRIPPASARADC